MGVAFSTGFGSVVVLVGVLVLVFEVVALVAVEPVGGVTATGSMLAIAVGAATVNVGGGVGAMAEAGG